MRTKSEYPDSQDHFLLVRSGGHRCAIPVESAKLVTRAPKIFPLPGTASKLLGLAQVAGEPVAVVDLHALLDPDGRQGGGHELTVVIRQPGGGLALGLAVDEAFGVVEAAQPSERADNDPEWVVGRFSMDDRTVVILDPELLFVPASAV